MPRGGLALALLVAGCVKPPATPTRTLQTVALATTTPACFDPASYGAIAGDGLSDRTAFQAALDAACASPLGGTVCVGPGDWTFERAPLGSYNHFAALATHCDRPVTIRGAGPESRLSLVGDQGGSTTILLAVDPAAQHVRVTELTIASPDASNTDEQTHAIATTGVCAGATCLPIRGLEVDHVNFAWPRNTAARKGDCIRLLGNSAPTTAPTVTAGTELYGVRIHDNTGDCARSFVEIQRGVHDLVIANNTITCATCDQDVDGEATGVNGAVGAPTDVVISGNTFTDGPGVQGDFSIALTSVIGGAIAGNTLPRGIAMYRSTGIAIAGNRITAGAMTTDVGVIDVQNVCEGTTISGNSIVRGGHAGPALKLVPHSGALCNGFAVTGNTIVQGTAFHGIYGESWSRAKIGDNVTTYTVTAPGYSGIYNRSVYSTFPVHDVSISGNVVAVLGPALGPTYAVTLHASPGTYGAAVVVSINASSATLFGLHLDGPASNFAAAITSSGGAIGADAYGSVLVEHGD